MDCGAVTYLITLTTVLSQSAGELVTAPSNAESKVGDMTYLNCSTDLHDKEIFWHHGQRYIYTGDAILEPYQGRFRIDRNASIGSHNLVIHSVQPSDAGEYICIDDDGFGTRRSAELVVLDNDPDCESNIQSDGVIGQNVFDIPPDVVELTCTVTYHGNIPPQMEWMKVGDKIPIKDPVTFNITSNSRIIYTLKVKGDISLDNASHVCQTKRSTRNQYTCTSRNIKVLYFIGGKTKEQNVVRGADISCFVSNNTFPCISQWYHGNYTCPLSCAVTIKTHLLGEYMCTVKCSVRGNDYFFNALKAVVVDPTTHPPPPPPSESRITNTIIISSVVVTVVVTVGALAGVLICVFFRNPKKKGAIPNEEMALKETDEPIRGIIEIPRRICKMGFINRGSSGEIYGPFDFQGIKCVCEQIWFFATSITEDDICGPGRRWMSLGHRNVLKFYDVLFKPPAFYAVMEYAEGGSVRKTLNSCTKDLKISVVTDWATQIADGMYYLHSNDIIHCGLKAAQILTMEPFDPAYPSPLTLKISSYRLITVNDQSAPVTFQGMFAWMSPETIRGDPTGKASDVWSYGVTVWEILTRAIPHMGVKQAVLMKELSDGCRILSVPSRCPNTIRAIFDGCWQWDVNKRSTFSQIVTSLHAVANVLWENSP